MRTIFWERRGTLHIDFLTRVEMVNVKRYCRTLQKLRQTIQNNRHEMLNAGVVMLHGNVQPHTAQWTTHLLQAFSWEVFNLTPYSRDLTPSDFHIFLHLKKFLSGQCQCFQNDREAEMSVTQWFQSQARDIYDTGVQIWSHGMTNVSVQEVYMLKNSSILFVYCMFQLTFPLTWILFP